ncbi:MAG: hypothetical protein H6710_04240 [Myxococcales bacterium]|nr:hypothetical protein [Myxococcales bacterium]
MRTLSQALMVSIGGLALACAEDTITIDGELGRAIPLASGDASLIPRLLIRREGCPGTEGGCPSICEGPPASCPADACIPVVIDSLSPVTVLSADITEPRAERGCIEVRAAEGTLAASPTAAALADASARFRFSRLPMAVIPDDESIWSWEVGDDRASRTVGAILGGNLLRKMAIRLVHKPPDPATVAFYLDFPGSESALADQGRAFIPLQFPGQLLGKEITDVCAVNGEDCDFIGFEIDNDRIQSLVQPTQMVLDACLGPPPGGVLYDPTSRRCDVGVGPGSAVTYRTPTGRPADPSCKRAAFDVKAADQPYGGRSASLVVATGIPDMVLFEDSARRFFGELEALPACVPDEGTLGGLGAIGEEVAACLDGIDGELHAAGWPSAGSASDPLIRLRVRSVGLVPGLTEAAGIDACQRLESRVAALAAQCDGVGRELLPYPVSGSNCASSAHESALLLGEALIRDPAVGPSPSGWIRALVVPAEHPMAMAVRRDVVPEGLQPDGLLGTALLRSTDVILDYTDENAGIRVACTEPGDGACLALPACARASGGVAPSCCYGLPERLLTEMVYDLGLYGCCPALAEDARYELNCQARAEGREEPCPEIPCE